MGMVHSFLCSITFCCERVLTWVCCACLLITMMFAIVAMVFYGISVGYHFAHNELANWSRENATLSKVIEVQPRYIEKNTYLQEMMPRVDVTEANDKIKYDEKKIQHLIDNEQTQTSTAATVSDDVITIVFNPIRTNNNILRLLVTRKKETETTFEDSSVTVSTEVTENPKLLEVIPLRTTRPRNIVEQLENEMASNNSGEILIPNVV